MNKYSIGDYVLIRNYHLGHTDAKNKIEEGFQIAKISRVGAEGYVQATFLNNTAAREGFDKSWEKISLEEAKKLLFGDD